MRRLFIIRKDLNLSPGKLSAMVGHLCESYWTNLLKGGKIDDGRKVLPTEDPLYPGRPMLYRHPAIYKMAEEAFKRGEKTFELSGPAENVTVTVEIPRGIWDGYVNDIFTKTICECRNLNQLQKAREKALELGLQEGKDFGYVDDRCLTELSPENEDGTCTIGMWFRPLPDEIAHSISKKFKLYH